MTRQSTRLLWIALNLGLGAAGLAAFAMNGDWAAGLAVLVLVVAAVVVIEIARRRNLGGAVGALTGVGDERSRSLYRRANADAGEVFSYALALWALWTIAQGEEDRTLMTVVFVYGVVWVLSAARVGWASRRPVAANEADPRP